MNTYSMPRRKAAFTLIELLIVVAIIAIPKITSVTPGLLLQPCGGRLFAANRNLSMGFACQINRPLFHC